MTFRGGEDGKSATTREAESTDRDNT